MKKLFLTIMIGICLFAMGKGVVAQSLLQYPIVELGYCRDAKECYLYCEIPRNSPACWSYGQYKLGPQVLGVFVSDEQKKAMEAKASQMGITFPIAELDNCVDPIACQAYCDIPDHQASCSAFAQKHGINTGSTSASGDTLKLAETELGCSSIESCRQFCESHHDDCMAFAKRHGLSKQGETGTSAALLQRREEYLQKLEAALGCTSTVSCSKLCLADKPRCMEVQKTIERSFQQLPSPTPPSQSVVPQGYEGCRTYDECKSLCQQNPAKCPGFSGSATYPKPSYAPINTSPGPVYQPTPILSPSVQPQTINPNQ